MKYTTTLFSAARLPYILQFRVATLLSLSTTTFGFRGPVAISVPTNLDYYYTVMTTTRRQTRLLQSDRDDTIDSKPPMKKKVKTVKKATAKAEITVLGKARLEDGKPWYTYFTRGDAIYDAYMAKEWGYEKHTDQALFEKLCLEGAQAGLTWRTILHKRDAYRKTFHYFDVELIANMQSSDVERIMNEVPLDSKNTTAVIVRNRAKVESVIHNAKLVLQMKQEHIQNNRVTSVTSPTEVFAHYLWSFVDHKPILNYRALNNLTSTSSESEAMSASLKKKYGFKFVGPTTCYSLMQATGMVIDHPYNTPEWHLAYKRLQQRPGGYQDRK